MSLFCVKEIFTESQFKSFVKAIKQHYEKVNTVLYVQYESKSPLKYHFCVKIIFQKRQCLSFCAKIFLRKVNVTPFVHLKVKTFSKKSTLIFMCKGNISDKSMLPKEKY